MSRRGSGSRGGRGGSRGGGRNSSRGGGRNQYERTDRVGELIREIVAEELRRIDDEELAFVTVTGVEVDRELYRAHVFLSTLDLEDPSFEAIDRHAKRLRGAVARQARIRKTPELVFMLDPGLVSGTRVGEILQENRTAELAASDERDERDEKDLLDSPYKSDRDRARQMAAAAADEEE